MHSNQVPVTCHQCGKEFTRCFSQIKKRVFCNKECYSAWKASRWNVLTCQFCDKQFRRTKGRASYKKTFCSIACHDKWRRQNQRGENHHQYKRIETTCAECGKLLWVTPAKLKQNERCFCGNECRYMWNRHAMTGINNPAWRGGYEQYYGPNWPTQRRKARKRDDYTCQRCSITEEEYGQSLCVHHIIPFREYGLERYKEANKLTNLISYCISCHGTIEHGTQPK